MVTPADLLAAIEVARAEQIAAIDASKAADAAATPLSYTRQPWRCWRANRRARQLYAAALAATARYDELLLQAAPFVGLAGTDDQFAVQYRLPQLAERARRDRWYANERVLAPSERGTLADALRSRRRIGLAAA